MINREKLVDADACEPGLALWDELLGPTGVIQEWTYAHQIFVLAHNESRKHWGWLVAEGMVRQYPMDGVDFSGADLEEADLEDADLRGADLEDADLSCAYLIGAILDGANLKNADLVLADLTGAKLRNADLRGSRLGGSWLRGADLTGAVLGDHDPYYLRKRGAIL